MTIPTDLFFWEWLWKEATGITFYSCLKDKKWLGRKKKKSCYTNINIIVFNNLVEKKKRQHKTKHLKNKNKKIQQTKQQKQQTKPSKQLLTRVCSTENIKLQTLLKTKQFKLWKYINKILKMYYFLVVSNSWNTSKMLYLLWNKTHLETLILARSKKQKKKTKNKYVTWIHVK